MARCGLVHVFCLRTDEQMALKKQQKESAEVPAHREQRRGTEAGTRSSDQLSGVSHDAEPCSFSEMCEVSSACGDTLTEHVSI